MKVKLCEECPYTPEHLADHYEANVALFLCANCNRGSSRNTSELVERLRTLRPRERQVMDLLCGGFKPREIAEKLGVTAHTIRVYNTAIRLKMGAQSVSDLLQMSTKIINCSRNPNEPRGAGPISP
jgi:FixJ family two-component response regulator